MSFKDLNLIEPLQKALEKQGYSVPTPIQAKAIPALLEGKDIIGIAQTGTGKTAAFVLPILQRMVEKYPRSTQTIVLAPTRELAAQIGESFSAYGEFLKFKHTVIFGGVGYQPQIQAIKRGVDIIIATPGRFIDLLNQNQVSLKTVEFFVLDEADRMLDMGFIHDIKKIIAQLPQKRQSFFFSATMSKDIDVLAKTLLKNPVQVQVTPQATTVERIKQAVYFVDSNRKDTLLLDLLKQEHLKCVLIFTRTKHKANKVADFLNDHGISADAIHGNKSQAARTHALNLFKTGKSKVLVATDIAARGIDIDNISHVINYELPNEPESYVHRIGRTARAGAEGTAYSFCAADERNFLRDIERLTRQTLEVMEHPHHSERAQHATGSDARPLPKQAFRRGQRINSSRDGLRSFDRAKASNRSFGDRPFTRSHADERPRSFDKPRSVDRSSDRPRSESYGSSSGSSSPRPSGSFETRSRPAHSDSSYTRSTSFNRSPAPSHARPSYGGNRPFTQDRPSNRPESNARPAYRGGRSEDRPARSFDKPRTFNRSSPRSDSSSGYRPQGSNRPRSDERPRSHSGPRSSDGRSSSSRPHSSSSNASHRPAGNTGYKKLRPLRNR